MSRVWVESIMMIGVNRVVLALLLSAILATAVGRDRKGKISIVVYAAAIPLAFVNSGISCALYVLVAILWLLPDRRIEKTLHE